MRKVLSAAAVLAMMAVPAWAQSSAQPSTAPSTENSGAGIAGKPGNKNGPALNAPGTTGAGPSEAQTNSGTSMDASKIKGAPGNKSGPAVKPPSGSSSGK